MGCRGCSFQSYTVFDIILRSPVHGPTYARLTGRLGALALGLGRLYGFTYSIIVSAHICNIWVQNARQRIHFEHKRSDTATEATRVTGSAAEHARLASNIRSEQPNITENVLARCSMDAHAGRAIQPGFNARCRMCVMETLRSTRTLQRHAPRVARCGSRACQHGQGCAQRSKPRPHGTNGTELARSSGDDPSACYYVLTSYY